MKLLINIDVDDLDRAVAFYCQAFDLQTGRRFGEGVVELLGGPAPIYLLAKPAGSMASAAQHSQRNYQRHWTPVHLDLVVDDIDVALARALAAGASLERGVSEQAYGKLALLADPFGHGFCLLQFIGAGYDALLAGEGGDDC